MTEQHVISSLIFIVFENIDLTKISKADLVILHATAFGNVALRDENTGSIFIQKLCEELKIQKNRTIYQDC